MSKLLSIIVPVYNESSYLERSLANITSGKIEGWDREVIVVDDGSTDGTTAILQKVAGIEKKS